MSPNKKIRILVLETQLDDDIESARSQKEFMHLLGQVYAYKEVEVVTKEVHSAADVKHFLNLARENRSLQVIHFVAHGTAEGLIRLTNGDRIDLRKTSGRELFRDMRQKYFIFSCCGIGREQRTLDQLRKISGASGIFAYVGTVYDYQSFLIDAMLYHLLLGDLPKKEENVNLKLIHESAEKAIKDLMLYRKGRTGMKVLGASYN